MRILYMTSSALPNITLINHLKSSPSIDLCGLVEEVTTKLDRVGQLFYKKGLVKKADITAFRFLHRFLPSADAEYGGIDNTCDVPRLTTADINSPEVIFFIERQAPDLVLIKGVSMIAKETIEALKAKIVNIHSGWLPCYRGVQCGTWPLVKSEIDKIGITFHYVDEGIDTGRIILRKKISKEVILKTGFLTFHQDISLEQYNLIVDSLAQFYTAYREDTGRGTSTAPAAGKPYSYIGLIDFIRALHNLNRYKKQNCR